MSTPSEARVKLDGYADELDQLSRELANVQRLIEPVEREHNDFIDDFIAGMYERFENGEGKWPSDEARTMLARRAMDRDLRDRYDALCASRDRMRKRISDLKSSVEAQRSILSALKVELEATL